MEVSCILYFSEVRFVAALVYGLWKCLAFFTAAVKALHSIHCEAPPQISPQSPNIRLEWNGLFMQRKNLSSIRVIGGTVWPSGKYLKTQNVHSWPGTILDQQETLVKTTST